MRIVKFVKKGVTSTSIILICVMLFLCACGQADVDVPSESIVLNLPNAGKKAPSDELIVKDVSIALIDKNPNIVLTNLTVLKSQGDASKYIYTMQVEGRSKYADWILELDISYGKYDQGWLVDNINWSNESYDIVRIPEIQEMSEYVTTYLSEHEEYSTAYYADYMFPMNNVTLQSDHNEATTDIVLEICWNANEELKYHTKIWRFKTLWYYNGFDDCWELLLDSDAGSWDYDYCVETILTGQKLHNYDFSGERELVDFRGRKISTLQISNFSWQEFDAYIPECMSQTEHFTVSENDSKYPNYSCAFKSEKGDYITFLAQEKTMYIYYYSNDNSVAACVTVTEELPEL